MKSFWSRVGNIQNLHSFFPFKIITRLMFTTKSRRFHYAGFIELPLRAWGVFSQSRKARFSLAAASLLWAHAAVTVLPLLQAWTRLEIQRSFPFEPKSHLSLRWVVGFFRRSERSLWLWVMTTNDISFSLQMTFLFITFYLQLILDQNLVYLAWQPVFLSAPCHSQRGYLIVPFSLVCLSSHSWLWNKKS